MSALDKASGWFNSYELLGIIIPGAALLFGCSFIVPQLSIVFVSEDFGLGNLGLFIIIAFVAGHFIQAFGNLLEALWWFPWGGQPSNWVLGQKQRTGCAKTLKLIISDVQIDSMLERISSLLAIKSVDMSAMKKCEWHAISRQLYSAVSNAGTVDRLDRFNAIYGLNRGLCSALLLLLCLLLFMGLATWQLSLFLLISSFVFLFRMHRFGKLYAREMFIQFIQLPLEK